MTPFAKVADGRQAGALTRDDIIKALREYAELYGDSFTQSAFSPASAKRNGRPDLVEIYYKGRPDGSRWPSLNGIKKHFDGSWNDARAAAGFGPNSTGPARGRRKAGEAEPIFNVRERVVVIPNEKLKEARRRIGRLEDRAARQHARIERLVDELDRVKRDRPVVERLVPRARKPRTITKKIKVPDEKAERLAARLRDRLAEANARAGAIEDQLKAEKRDHATARRRIQRLEDAQDAVRAQAVDAQDLVREADRDRDRANIRLGVADSKIDELVGELEAAREQLLGAEEAAVASELVRAADRRAKDAEIRAARAEREMAEQASAITGELRRLTPAELAHLRSNGPAGEKVFGRALEQLMKARRIGGKEPQRAAILEVMRAGATWLDRL